MRFHPISSGREDNKISPGSVVEYEQHGKPSLAIVIAEKKGAFQVVNERGQELSLPAERIFLLPAKLDESLAARKDSLDQLQAIREEAEIKRGEIDLPSLWELTKADKREISEKAAVEILFPNASAAELLAVRRALAEDAIYFKRRKSGFEPRPADVVEELKKKALAEAEKAKERSLFKSEIVKRLRGPAIPFERNWNSFGISDLEQLAALGGSSQSYKETLEFLDELNETEKLNLEGKPQEKAFQLLVKLGHFNSDSDIALIASGRPVYFPPHVLKELSALAQIPSPEVKGLVNAYSVTIDSESTRDIDDALSLSEEGDYFRIGIHISDVSAVVPLGSKLEEHALRRSTSVYTPDYQIPMFPPELSEYSLSLIQGEVRPVMSFYLTTDRLFEIKTVDVKRELIRVSKRLSYNEVDRILTDESVNPREGEYLGRMLYNLWDAASAFESKRIMSGALQFPRRELIPRIDADRKVTLDYFEEETPARKLVAEMMVAANYVAATYAKRNGIPVAFRSQESPDVDILSTGMDIPAGPAREYFRRGQMKRSVTSIEPARHSGLGLDVYTQITSPIRRALDLLGQRQIAAHLESGKPLFNHEEFRNYIEECESRLDEANYIQRQRNRYWILRYLEQKGEKILSGVIVRVENQRPLLELEELQIIFPFQPGKNVGEHLEKADSRLGERIRVRIQKLSAKDDKMYLLEELD